MNAKKNRDRAADSKTLVESPHQARLRSTREIVARLRARNDVLAESLGEPIARPELTAAALPGALQAMADARAVRVKTGTASPGTPSSRALESGVRLSREATAVSLKEASLKTAPPRAGQSREQTAAQGAGLESTATRVASSCETARGVGGTALSPTAFGVEEATARRAIVEACDTLLGRVSELDSPVAAEAVAIARATRDYLRVTSPGRRSTPDSVREMRAAVARLDATQKGRR